MTNAYLSVKNPYNIKSTPEEIWTFISKDRQVLCKRYLIGFIRDQRNDILPRLSRKFQTLPYRILSLPLSKIALWSDCNVCGNRNYIFDELPNDKWFIMITERSEEPVIKFELNPINSNSNPILYNSVQKFALPKLPSNCPNRKLITIQFWE